MVPCWVGFDAAAWPLVMVLEVGLYPCSCLLYLLHVLVFLVRVMVVTEYDEMYCGVGNPLGDSGPVPFIAQDTAC